ncbi:MAG TPA: DEAD/DEAH box helicase family protein, partial [Chloroflexota bacterium]|nr:DEAD/DEAH box helicase family protein [Chloroflexota bacterium]
MSAATAVRREQLVLRLPAKRSAFTLRPYQTEAVEAILAAQARGVRRQLIVLPTGAGKTEIFTQVIHRLGLRTLVLAHRDELIQQAVEKVWRRAPVGASVGVIKAERNETDGLILVGSIQTLAKEKRLRQLPDDIGLIVVDECHHAMSASYRRVLGHLGCLGQEGPLLLGFTATPDRTDGQRIGGTVFDELVYARSILELMEEGYLCDVEARSVHIEADLGAVRSRHGDLDAGELGRVLLHANAPARILEAY